MNAAIVFLVLLLAIAAAALLLARTERRRRVSAEQEAVRLTQQFRDGAGHREWLAVLGHELRSPVAAIMGYGELLAEGTFGTLDERTVDAVQRVRSAADQLLALIDGIDPRGVDESAAPPVSVPAAAILHAAASALAHEAEARQVRLAVQDADVTLITQPHAAERTLRLALGAAIKVSGGGALQLSAQASPDPRLVITGTALDPVRDDPDSQAGPGDTGLTGAGLRIALARQAALGLGGTVTLLETPDGTRIDVLVPSPPIDSAEDRP